MVATKAMTAAVRPAAVAPRSPLRYAAAPIGTRTAPISRLLLARSPSSGPDAPATSNGVSDSTRLVVATGCVSTATNTAPWLTA